jgi:uncharacterized membrane protein YuzA (DUF378 family)
MFTDICSKYGSIYAEILYVLIGWACVLVLCSYILSLTPKVHPTPASPEKGASSTISYKKTQLLRVL